MFQGFQLVLQLVDRVVLRFMFQHQRADGRESRELRGVGRDLEGDGRRERFIVTVGVLQKVSKEKILKNNFLRNSKN